MSKVIIRHGHTVVGQRIIYKEEPSTYEYAEQLAGTRLDRRKSYCIIRGKVCELLSYVTSCSGCFETEDGYPVGTYANDDKNNIPLGSGCHECGYQGKVRHSEWMPIAGSDHTLSEDDEEITDELTAPVTEPVAVLTLCGHLT